MHRNKVLTNFLILQNQTQPESESEKKKKQLNISGKEHIHMANLPFLWHSSNPSQPNAPKKK